MPLVSARGLGKRFPGVVALDGVDADFEAGSVHAIVGENGAGKSTLGKILAGLYTPDSGEIRLDGQRQVFGSPQEAASAGIAMVHQELLFAENLTVADNLCLGELPHRGPFVDEAEAVRRAGRFLEAIGARIDPRQRLGELPISRQQLVQIAAGIGRGARVLIFDEPTSSLSRHETERLLQLIRELRDRGVACVYVSHRLEEIFAVCDTATVLRDGRLVATAPISELTRDELVRLMIGRELAADLAEETNTTPGEELLRVEELRSPGKFESVSFSLRAGEILGFAGLVGAGRTEVAEALFGLDPEATGRVFVRGKAVRPRAPVAAMRLGIGLVPEDRKRHGLVLSMSARENVSLPTLDQVATAGWIRAKEERSLVLRFFDRMRVKASGPDAPTLGLSGGNQQKLVLAKWLAAESDILLVDEPTRGVDVGAKAEIHALIRGLALEGKGVVLISSDLPELLSLATRVLVMRDGKPVGELPAHSGEEAAMRLMAGVA